MGQIVTVNFRGDELYGVREGDRGYVALKPIVEALGLDWSSQHKRIRRDPILSEGMVIMTIDHERVGARDTACLRLDLVNGWLFTVDTGCIRDEAVRDKVIAYQREAYAVLASAFGVTRTAPEPVEIAHATACNLITECRRTYGTAAARQLWPRLGLPVVPAMLAATAASAQGVLFSEN